MNLRHLEVFHAVMEAGSVTEAAKRLNVSQPAVSVMLKHAESNLGIALFKRIGGRLTPTPEAEALRSDAARVFSRFEHFRRRASNLREGKGGIISVAGTPTLAHSILPRVLARFCEAHPDVTVNLDAISTTTIVERLLSGQLDLGLVFTPINHSGTEAETLSQLPLGVVVQRTHRLAQRRSITAADLVGERLIIYPNLSPIGNWAEHYCKSGDNNPIIAAQADSHIAACLLASEGIGIALADPLTLCTGAFPQLVMVPFKPVQVLPLTILTARARLLTRVANNFLEILRENIAAGEFDVAGTVGA